MRHFFSFAMLIAAALGLLLSASSLAEAKLKVHLVSHTHDDTGWLKTVDQYHYGANMSIQFAGTQYIITSVIDGLKKNPKRKFVYVEQAFFWRWWEEQEDSVKADVRKLVDNKQLQFANGGWCMHDEAATYYIDMIDQTTLGHRFLKNELNVIPLVGWQVDPFGHSNTQASLISAFSGFLSTIQGRADYEEYNSMCLNKGREFIWQGAESMPYSKILGGVLIGNLYCAPDHFNWDVRVRGGNPIANDAALTDYDLGHRVEEFVKMAQQNAELTLGDAQLWTMGCDFNYMASDFWYKNLDRIIDAVNKDGRVEAFYSTPLEYTEAKLAENVTFPSRTADFFPYEDWEYSFWTGYYTSRPALKRMIRDMSGFFTMSRQVAALMGHGHDHYLPAMARAMGLAQHHDAATGTSKQHVAFDYQQRMSEGAAGLRSNMVSQFNEMIGNVTHQSGSTPGPFSGAWSTCYLANETKCPVTYETLKQNGGMVDVIVWNQLGRTRDMIVRIPVPEFKTDVTGPAVVGHQTYFAAEAITNYATDINHDLLWTVAVHLNQVPALGFTTLRLTTTALDSDGSRKKSSPKASADEEPSLDSLAKGFAHELKAESNSYKKADVTKKTKKSDYTHDRRGRPLKSGQTISNGVIEIAFDDAGSVASVKDLATGVVVATSHQWCYYISNPGDKLSGQASGAYVFRPLTNGTCINVLTDGAQMGMSNKIDTRLLSEFDTTYHSSFAGSAMADASNPVETVVEQTFAPWLKQRLRLPVNAHHFEIEFTVGAIPINPMGVHGKEIVSKWSTNISNKATFYTDSNGRELQKRVLNYRPTWNFTNSEPVSGNYAPINAYAEIHDDNAQLSVMVDASNGGSSLNEGELEIMVHRRMLKDDGKGVNEVLNETQYVQSYYWNKPTTFGLSEGFHYGPGLIIRGTHYITVLPRGGSGSSSSSSSVPPSPASINRPLMDEIYAQPRPFFTAAASGSTPINTTYGFMARDLPVNVQLTTLELLNSTTMLLRLAHQFAVNEDPQLSQPVSVNLQDLFVGSAFSVVSYEEWSLSANQKLGEMINIRIPPSQRDPGTDYWHVHLGPMEVRTYVVRVKL